MTFTCHCRNQITDNHCLCANCTLFTRWKYVKDYLIESKSRNHFQNIKIIFVVTTIKTPWIYQNPYSINVFEFHSIKCPLTISSVARSEHNSLSKCSFCAILLREKFSSDLFCVIRTWCVTTRYSSWNWRPMAGNQQTTHCYIGLNHFQMHFYIRNTQILIHFNVSRNTFCRIFGLCFATG